MSRKHHTGRRLIHVLTISFLFMLLWVPNLSTIAGVMALSLMRLTSSPQSSKLVGNLHLIILDSC
ncbi:hypothetical protein LINPERPRIM_LOCUS3259 [Linum perenne]